MIRRIVCFFRGHQPCFVQSVLENRMAMKKYIQPALLFITAWGFALLAGWAGAKDNIPLLGYPAWWVQPVEMCSVICAITCGVLFFASLGYAVDSV